MPHAPPYPLRRRTVLAAAMATAGLLTPAAGQARSSAALEVANVTGLYTVTVARIEAPRSADEISALLRAWPGQVAVGGGRYSMGGQVAVPGGLHLDMRQMRGLLWLRADERRVRVQAGMRWRDLQDILDPLGLAVKTMQSYSNFTVGGSVSVNVHGRYVGHGPIAHSVRALQLVLADGRQVEASATARAELFAAAIGGYGAVGVITEVELDVADNQGIERVVQEVALEAYVEHFRQQVRADPRCVLQEYFVPERHFLGFARAMAQLLRAHDVEALNISIRHAPADRVALLPWAREDVFSFVLYHKQRTHAAAQRAVGRWTRELVAAVLQHQGRYYLPYQLHATQAQFDQAYPEAARLRRLKKEVDPHGRFSNALWQRYP